MIKILNSSIVCIKLLKNTDVREWKRKAQTDQEKSRGKFDMELKFNLEYCFLMFMEMRSWGQIMSQIYYLGFLEKTILFLKTL